MFGNTKTETRGRKSLSKKQTILNALLRGESVTWKQAQSKFNLSRPRAVVDKIREEGHCVYINKNKSGTYYRIGTPSKALIAAGFAALEPSVYA